MRCVVIGGAGFIGTHLTKALVTAGYEVRVFDRPEARYLDYCQQHAASLITGDFLNPEDLGRAVSNCEIVYHLVSSTVPMTSNEDPMRDVETNVLGTLRLLDEARKAGVKKVIFSSSGGTVYGIPKEIPIKEDHPTEPTSSYGICKLTIEKYLYLYWKLHGLDYCILRVANAYGERQPITETQGVISTFLDKALRKNEIPVWGDGSVIRDFTYAGDIANAFVNASNYEGEPRIFNIGGEQGISINEIISIISKITGQQLQLKYMTSRIFDVPVNILDISRAKKYLNWQPEVGLFEGISRMHEWILKGL